MSLDSVLYDIKRTKNLQEKMKNEGKRFTEIKESAFENMERAARCAYGDDSHGYVTVKEAITSTDSMKLIPKVVEGQLREAAEPEYLGTKFFQKVKVDGGGNSITYVVPVVGEVRAYEVGEGTRYKEDQPDFNTLENANIQIKMKKVGVKVSVTEEALNDSSWDIWNINIRKMGRALGRGNGLTFGALGGNNVHPNGAIQGTPAAFGMANNGDGQKFIMKPEQVQNRVPFGLTVNMSPWVEFDKANKRFDMYCVDRNEVGIIAQSRYNSSTTRSYY